MKQDTHTSPLFPCDIVSYITSLHIHFLSFLSPSLSTLVFSGRLQTELLTRAFVFIYVLFIYAQLNTPFHTLSPMMQDIPSCCHIFFFLLLLLRPSSVSPLYGKLIIIAILLNFPDQLV